MARAVAMTLVDKQFAVIGGSAGALEIVRQMREALEDAAYVRWLDKLIADGTVGQVLFARREAITHRIPMEMTL